MRSLQQLIHKGLTASPSKHIVEVSGFKGAEVSGIKGVEVSGIDDANAGYHASSSVGSSVGKLL